MPVGGIWQEKPRPEIFWYSLAPSGRNITEKVKTEPRRLSKEVLKTSLSDRSSFMESLQPVQKDIWAGEDILFRHQLPTGAKCLQ